MHISVPRLAEKSLKTNSIFVASACDFKMLPRHAASDRSQSVTDEDRLKTNSEQANHSPFQPKTRFTTRADNKHEGGVYAQIQNMA